MRSTIYISTYITMYFAHGNKAMFEYFNTVNLIYVEKNRISINLDSLKFEHIMRFKHYPIKSLKQFIEYLIVEFEITPSEYKDFVDKKYTLSIKFSQELALKHDLPQALKLNWINF